MFFEWDVNTAKFLGCGTQGWKADDVLIYRWRNEMLRSETSIKPYFHFAFHIIIWSHWILKLNPASAKLLNHSFWRDCQNSKWMRWQFRHVSSILQEWRWRHPTNCAEERRQNGRTEENKLSVWWGHAMTHITDSNSVVLASRAPRVCLVYFRFWI